MEYPALEPPKAIEHLFEVDCMIWLWGKSWTKREAKLFYQWYLDILPERTAIAKQFLGVEQIQDPCELFDAIGEKVVPLLQDSPFTVFVESTEPMTRGQILPELTLAGNTLAIFDLGMICASQLLCDRPTLAWKMAEGPKIMNDHYHPVLSGFRSSWLNFDPIDDVSGVAMKMLHAHDTKELTEFYLRWKARIP